VNVPVETSLSWKIALPEAGNRFRLLASTGGTGGLFGEPEDVNPFSLVELATDPAQEVRIGYVGFVSCLDFSPDGVLYGADGELCAIDPDRGVVRIEYGTLHTPDGAPAELTGMAFHPDGTLYGYDWDLLSDENVFYVIDIGKRTATEISRTPASTGSIWGIDFSPDGVLYGAFAELVKFDLAKGTASIVGRPFSLPFVNDIDYAPDGFIYGVDNTDRKLYKIDPSTGLVVQEYGPYGSSLWGLASQSLDGLTAAAAARTAGVNAADTGWVQALAETWAAPTDARGPNGRSPAGEELAALAERSAMLDRLAAREVESIPAAGGVTDLEPDTAAAPLLHVAAQPDSGGITCEVYLDIVNPPVRLVNPTGQPPAEGDTWTWSVGVLQPGTTYFWRVVAKSACGATTAGDVWSFRTEGPLFVFEDTFSSTTIDKSRWVFVHGATVEAAGINEPSGPYSLRLNGNPADGTPDGDRIESKVIDLSSCAGATLTYSYERTGEGESPEPGDDLIVEYHDGARWVELDRQDGGGPDLTDFESKAVILPPAALHADFQLRFRSIGTDSSVFVLDDWFVDDVRIQTTAK
jgi:hypothetical protein